MKRPIITCACCGRTGPHWGRGLRDSCHRRISDAGRLDDWPRTRIPYGTDTYTLVRPTSLGRVEDYAELRRLGVPQAEAARRIGITYRTASRYNRYLESLEQESVA